MPAGCFSCGSCWELQLLAVFPIPELALPTLPTGPSLT